MSAVDVEVTREDREAAVVTYYGDQWRTAYPSDAEALQAFVDTGDRMAGGIVYRARQFARHRIASCAQLRAENAALHEEVARRTFPCRQCGKACEPERYNYATPVCFACLPPPPPIPVRAVVTKEPRT
jgi:hypothetical protein